MTQGPGGALAEFQPLSFGDLPNWGEDDLAEALTCFRTSAAAIATSHPPLRPAVAATESLAQAAQAALRLPVGPSRNAARAFFERHFTPFRVAAEPRRAFFTGYYEPVVPGAMKQSSAFAAPILARPPDLKTFAIDEKRPDALSGFSAARIAPDGTLHPYPDRTAIEAAAVDGALRPVVWLRDWTEVFLIQVQGSARVHLPDGRMLRLTYAGRNGHPYTSIGKALIDEGAMAPSAKSLDGLKAWLRENGQEPGDRGRRLMQRNASYVFFEATSGGGDAGPIGGQGVALTELRSIAVDRTLWCYGLPFWIDAVLPWRDGPPSRFCRLTMARDTGSAIIGPGRADVFFGSDETAGRLAGSIRHNGDFVVLRPKANVGGPW